MSDFDYIVKEDGTGLITDCHIEDLYTLTEIRFPSEIDGITVTEIDTGFLKHNEILETIIIPESIVNIHHTTNERLLDPENPIFPNCVNHIIVDENNPKFFVIDDILYSQDPAHFYKELTFYPRNKRDKYFEIPKDVDAIGSYAFAGAKYLQYVSSDNLSEINIAAFAGCKALKEFSFPSIRDISQKAFSFCLSLQKVNLPSCLEFLGDFSFEYCYSLKYVKIDSANIQLSARDFAFCHSVEKYEITEKNKFYITIDDVVYCRPKIDQMFIISKFNNNKYKFWTSYNLVLYPAAKKDKSYTLPANINCISDVAFGYLQNLEELYIPQHCEYTPEYFDNRKRNIVKKYYTNTDKIHSWKIIEEKDNPTEIPYITTDKVIIVGNKWDCIKNNHHLVTKEGKIRLLDENNHLHDIIIQLGLCLECNRYYIYSTLFNQLILNRLEGGCKIVGTQFRLPNGNTLGINFQGYGNMRTESILKVCGYHVGNYSSLSKKERIQILKGIIEKELLTKQEILSYLNHFINVNGKRGADMSQAVSEWEEDMLAL